MCKKICVIFPGIGYHSDKPLLYYGKKYMAEHGYEIIGVKYGKLPKGLEAAFSCGYDITVRFLADICFGQEDDIVFMSKSIGTVIAARYAQEFNVNARNIYFTPLISTMKYADNNGIAFHGTKDPLADTEKLTDACIKRHIPLYTYEGGNHSIETKDILWNIRTQEDVAKKYIQYLKL